MQGKMQWVLCMLLLVALSQFTITITSNAIHKSHSVTVTWMICN